MKAKMKDNIIFLYEQSLPGELDCLTDVDRQATINFLKSIEGREVNLVFTGGDAFEEVDNNIWLPGGLWDALVPIRKDS